MKLQPYEPHTTEEPDSPDREAPGRRFWQVIGLSPVAAVLAIVVDLALSSIDIASGGLLLPFSLVSAAVLGWITYKIQMKSGDDADTSKIKGLCMALLTALPIPVTPLLAAPAGIAGLINALRSRGHG